MKTLLLGLLLIWVAMDIAQAQDYPLSQPTSNPFLICPALTGNAVDPRISSFSRLPPTNNSSLNPTTLLGFDTQINKMRGGVGLYGVYNVTGRNVLTEWSLNGIYSFHYAINSNLTYRIGVQCSYVHKFLDYSKLTFPDQLDPRHGFVFSTNLPQTEGGINKSYFDLGFSAAVDWKKWTAGVSSFHLLKPSEGFMYDRPLDRTYSFFAGYDLWQMKGEKPEGFHVSPLAWMQTTFIYFRVLAGSDVSWNNLFAGVYYRMVVGNADAVVFRFGSRFRRFQAGYSYDLTVYRLSNAPKGGHEVFLNYFFAKK